MFTRSENFIENTSTPKRRRLGTGRILRLSQHILGDKNILPSNNNTDNEKYGNLMKQVESCDSPLPCNQIEYLCDSGNTSTASNDIPCSPGIVDCSVLQDIRNWETLLPKPTISIKEDLLEEENHEQIDDIYDDMFKSNLVQESCQMNIENGDLKSKQKKPYREIVEESFDLINQSIIKESCRNNDLFETKDSFLLNVKESELLPENNLDNQKKVLFSTSNYYGLSKKAMTLIKTYRNIEKFYDWQEECLNLNAIRNRQNLIYALPTSGGKTLVAEVLMLQEVINKKKNALFILPYVAIVQEKIWSLSPFAVDLDFLVEEYAGGKGHIPPKKRRIKHSIYIATIEKALALIRSLVELNRLHEIGLIVVDELHLIGEPGRGGTLEMLLTTVMFANQGIQIVGMSATIGNLPELAQFLKAEVYERQFRPVELTEYVKLGDVLHRIEYKNGFEIVPDRKLEFNYSPAHSSIDPDCLGGLVGEVVPKASCLVFCSTKRNCENVATLLARLQTPEMLEHKHKERVALCAALVAEGANAAHARTARAGVAWHHAGLAPDERALIEQAFRNGVLSVLCCTSTLAAGVNLPAQRVIIRAPLVGRNMLTLAQYRQMVGRAGRAGVCDHGESIVISGDRDWARLKEVLQGEMSGARSMLQGRLSEFVLSGVALQLAKDRRTLRNFLENSLLPITHDETKEDGVNIKQLCDDALRDLLKNGALEVSRQMNKQTDNDKSHIEHSKNCIIYDNTELAVSNLGQAAIKGCMDLSTAKELLKDLETASKSIVLMGSLHLFYLVTPHDAAGIKPDYRHYYSIYCNMNEEGVQTAKVLGITEMNAIRMMTGKPITNVSERVLNRFYLALMLYDLWKQMPLPAVAEKYLIPRGTIQNIRSSACALASSASRFASILPALWLWAALLAALAPALHACDAPELSQLMELPNVKQARAHQLYRAGYKRIEDLAKANVEDLTSSISNLHRTAANHLISAARLMLIEKVENLRSEAEDVMEELNV